jgi:hypothetical protein
MSTVSFGSSLTLNQFADAIATVGSEVTIIGQGEPGIGKSSVLKMLASRFPEHEIAYIDCTLLDLSDFALPYTTEENAMRVTRFAPNARFKLHTGKPVIIMLDEIGKAIKSVKNVLLTLMLEQRIGEDKLPAGSVVFGTTNLSSDGVGDVLEAHARNRVCFTTVKKPAAGFNADGSVDSDSWGTWALNNDIAPEVIAWVRQYPHALESYTDPSQRENPYIFNPVKMQHAFVTPRSLEKASHIAKRRSVLGDAVTISMLSGTIGESAARDMQAFFTVVDKLPTWESIIADPLNARVPSDSDAVAKCILVFSALSRVDKSTFDKWMDYAPRLDMEWQALFAKSIVKSTTKVSMAVSNEKFKKWAIANQWLF